MLLSVVASSCYCIAIQLFAELDNHALTIHITKAKRSTSVIVTEFNHVINDSVVYILAIELLHLLAIYNNM